MSNFIQAMTQWNADKDSFVKSKLEPGISKAPRKTLLVTIPVEFEEDVKSYIKEKRKEADSKHVDMSGVRKTELMLEFEASNPPPKRSDYE